MLAIRMLHEPNDEVADPTMEDVRSFIGEIAADNGEPVLVLQAHSVGMESQRPSELWIARVNVLNAGNLAGWLVRFKASAWNDSLVLAAHVPRHDAFQTYELFGAIYEIQSECVVPLELAYLAVPWFILHGVQCPSQAWLGFKDCVRIV
jgi:hypothetical protein